MGLPAFLLCECELDWASVPFFAALNPADYRLISCDIFDTLLHRAVAAPRDLFVFVGVAAQARALLPSLLDAHGFAELRVRMERAARQRARALRGSGEVNREQIWAEAPVWLPHRSELMALELQVEYDLSFPNPYTRSFLLAAHAQGVPICLTSDTYFARDFIGRLLAKAGLGDATAITLLLSNEQGQSKAEGGLFDRLLERFAPIAPPQAILHIGDHLTSDGWQPRARGIQARVLIGGAEASARAEQAAVLGIERLDGDVARALRGLGDLSGDGLRGDEAALYAIGATVLGPALAFFALWVVEQAAREELELLCPVMREATVFAPLLRAAAEVLGHELRTHESLP
jgi:FMN phosphatase YigB (HAD superfamily)